MGQTSLQVNPERGFRAGFITVRPPDDIQGPPAEVLRRGLVLHQQALFVILIKVMYHEGLKVSNAPGRMLRSIFQIKGVS
ncbi:hypothetical protein BOX24_08475 [Leptospirillum ferriphilum]|uniref:Uncharacterized protein n=2 Tax=Leptospirillum ferriphilum TaxID=178606 RepID=A0A059XY19_9BACT|nr:hypothetical protein Y981_12460 [Leptospirillum ferriphilum YSK]OOH71541.1 hypothetical protein BOX24_08475 [Leptospirillum ferriphilum]